MKTNLSKFSLFLLLAIGVSVVAIFNLFNNKGFSFHDETQIVNLHQYVKIFSFGQFPPRWSPDMNFAYGSPYPQFNYQLPYYLGVAFNKIGFSLLDSYKLILGTSVILGALGMYLFASIYLSSPIAFLASLLYTLTPYRAVDVFVRGTIGESFALGLFPWIFYFASKLKDKSSLKIIIFLAISISCLLLSHQPSAAFGLPIILGIFIFLAIFSKNYKFLFDLLKSSVISVLFSAYYLVPVILEKSLIQEVLPFNFYDHFPFIKQLIYSSWGYGSSNATQYDDMSFQIGFANLFIILVAILIIFFKRKISDKKTYIPTLITLGFTFIVLFLMNIRSSFFWKIYPFTNAIQFPWRLLTMTTILTSILFVYVSKILTGKLSKLFFIVVGLLAIAPIFYFHPGTIVDHSDNYYLRRYLPNQVLLEGEKVSKDYLDYTENYIPLPITAVRPSSMPDGKITGTQISTSVEITNTNPFNIKANLNTSSGDFVTIHNFYYPGWVVKLNGVIQKLAINKNGAMMIFVPKGSHSLDISYKDTPIRSISNIISLASIILATSLLIYNSKNKRGR